MKNSKNFIEALNLRFLAGAIMCCLLFSSCNIDIRYKVKVHYQNGTTEVVEFINPEHLYPVVFGGCLYRHSTQRGLPSGSAIRCGVNYISIIEKTELKYDTKIKN